MSRAQSFGAFPTIRLANAARRMAPTPGPLVNTVGLESIISGTGKLTDDPWVDSDNPGNLYDPGDILYGKLRPYLAKVWVADRPGNYIGDFIRMRPAKYFMAQYLKYALLTDQFTQQATNAAAGTKMPRTEWDSLKDLRIPAPPREIQHAIADYLDHETVEMDALMGDLETFTNLSRTRIESILESSLQGERFAQMEIRRLSPIRKSGTSVNGESEPATPGIPGVLKTGAVSKGWFDPSENKAVTDPQEVARLTAPIIGDRVLINRANTPALVGSAVYVADSCDDIYLSDKLWSVDFKAVNAYVALTLSTRAYKEQISTHTVGASSSMQNLSYEDFLSVRIPVPDERIQREVVARADSLISRGLEVEKEVKAAITLARERRAALITAAVTGQIDVTARNKPAAEQLEDDIAQGLHREN